LFFLLVLLVAETEQHSFQFLDSNIDITANYSS
jgi:hypothetical protein